MFRTKVQDINLFTNTRFKPGVSEEQLNKGLYPKMKFSEKIQIIVYLNFKFN